MMASNWGRTEIVKFLVENGTSVRKAADINAKDRDNKTALMYASDWGSIDIIKYLVESGAAK